MIDLAMLKFVLVDSVQLLKLIALFGGPVAAVVIFCFWIVVRRKGAN